jgi:arginine-tRNA-protein transferase
MIFRPRCEHCFECVSLRIPVVDFEPTRSQRRVLKRSESVTMKMGVPLATPERLALWRRWHLNRESTRGWEERDVDETGYTAAFAVEHPAAAEFSYWLRERLIAVDLVDVTPRALSSIYFFFDPEFSDLSPGVGSVLRSIQWARGTGREFVYLGYRIRDCPSSVYKARFRPHELLVGRPEFDEIPTWRPERPEEVDAQAGT